MDPETMYDDIANVGIKDGKIAVIAKDMIQGKETINAKGLVVAPGFIDTHFHSIQAVGYKLGLRDGVTTGMDLEMGTQGSHMKEWYAKRAGKTRMNYGAAVSHELARAFVLDGNDGVDILSGVRTRADGDGWSSRQPNLEEGNGILKNLDEGLQAGAIGIGSTVGYMRAGVSAREMFEVQRLAARYGRQTSVHFRYTPGTATTEANGLQEALANAVVLDAPFLACHFNNPGWELVHELLTRARAEGHNVWGEIYPYAAGSTTLNAVFLRPEMWIDQLGNRYEDTLFDPATNTFFTRETYASTLKTDPTHLVVVYKSPPEDVVKWLSLPGVSIGADNMPFLPVDQELDTTPYEQLANTHPRTAGAHAKTLRLGRENAVPLMQSLSQLSYVSAKHLGEMGLEAMQVRGRLQQGMVADIAIFNPETVTDHSTYEKGMLPSTGFAAVIVNGKVVVKDDKVNPDVFPGQPIRFAESEKGLFKPLKIEDWVTKYTVAPMDFGGTSGLNPTK